jgi:hypothetical protein
LEVVTAVPASPSGKNIDLWRLRARNRFVDLKMIAGISTLIDLNSPQGTGPGPPQLQASAMCPLKAIQNKRKIAALAITVVSFRFAVSQFGLPS